MKREIKMAISGALLIFSVVAILVVMTEATSPNAPLTILLLIAVFFVSMTGLITFSKTGWRVRGSEDEWFAAILMNRFSFLFWNRNYKEEVKEGERMDQKKDDEYYKKRSE